MVDDVSFGGKLIDIKFLAEQFYQKTLNLGVSKGFVVMHHLVTKFGVIMLVGVVNRVL